MEPRSGRHAVVLRRGGMPSKSARNVSLAMNSGHEHGGCDGGPTAVRLFEPCREHRGCRQQGQPQGRRADGRAVETFAGGIKEGNFKPYTPCCIVDMQCRRGRIGDVQCRVGKCPDEDARPRTLAVVAVVDPTRNAAQRAAKRMCPRRGDRRALCCRVAGHAPSRPNAATDRLPGRAKGDTLRIDEP
jgi:hypothetical protein